MSTEDEGQNQNYIVGREELTVRQGGDDQQFKRIAGC